MQCAFLMGSAKWSMRSGFKDPLQSDGKQKSSRNRIWGFPQRHANSITLGRYIFPMELWFPHLEKGDNDNYISEI